MRRQRRERATLAAAGCRKFIVHARIALLSGLSPKENRSIPPLKYERVYRLKQTHPQLDIVLNGGLQTIDQVASALEHVDGVMIGREAYNNPWFLAELESAFGSGEAPRDRAAVVESMLPYVQRELDSGVRLHNISRHMLGLFAGQPGARTWRRFLSENARGADAPATVLVSALDAMRRAAA